VPHPGPVTEQNTAAGGKSGALRAGIFGLNDGLVSNLSLIFGVAGAGVSNHVVIIAGIAGLLAGAFSMGAGEYVSMRVQREVFERLIHLEAHELGTQPEEEQQELVDIYVSKGFSRDLAERIADEVHRDPDLALDTHAREELGLDPQEGLGSPWAAAGTSFATFSMGAIVPLIPFLFTQGGRGRADLVGDRGRHAVRRGRRRELPHRPPAVAVGREDAADRCAGGRHHLRRRHPARRRGGLGVVDDGCIFCAILEGTAPSSR
jgi:VIT1/CCC1 family predicted Fe2+/Mn2+ transporter